jgi:hypothetical protein
MIKVSMNIGGGNGTSYNKIPMFWEFESIRTFTDFIRENMFNILLYSHDNYGIKSNCWIGVHIERDIDEENCLEWDFIINCKNIREFKPFVKMSREEMDSLRVERDRNDKLNGILND